MVYTKYWLCPDSLDSGTKSIGYVDRLYSTSSKSEEYLSMMVMNLNLYPEHWKTYPIGNSKIPISSPTSPLIKSPIEFSKVDNTTWLEKDMMITQSRIPEDAAGHLSTTWHCPGHFMRSVNIHLKIGSHSCPADQSITIKLCRLTDAEPQQCNALTTSQRKDLCNQTNITTDKTWETVWCYSARLKGQTQLNKGKYREISIKKKIKMAYLRSFVRKSHNLSSDTTYGHMQKPTFIQGDSSPGLATFKMYNNLYLWIGAKLPSKDFTAGRSYHDGTTTISPPTDTNYVGTTDDRVVSQPMVAATTTINGTGGFARFSVQGTVTLGSAVHAFTRAV